MLRRQSDGASIGVLRSAISDKRHAVLGQVHRRRYRGQRCRGKEDRHTNADFDLGEALEAVHRRGRDCSPHPVGSAGNCQGPIPAGKTRNMEDLGADHYAIGGAVETLAMLPIYIRLMVTPLTRMQPTPDHRHAGRSGCRSRCHERPSSDIATSASRKARVCRRSRLPRLADADPSTASRKLAAFRGGQRRAWSALRRPTPAAPSQAAQPAPAWSGAVRAPHS